MVLTLLDRTRGDNYVSFFQEDRKQPAFWRRDDPEFKQVTGELMPRTGTQVGAPELIRGGMFKHQRDWWEATNFIKALVTGYGGGKTLIGAKRAIAMALYNYPSPVAWVSPTFKIARRTVIPAIKDLLYGKQSIIGDRDLTFNHNKQDGEFHIRYMGVNAFIWIMSGDDPDALKGPNLSSAYIDEPFIQDRLVFEQILARVRDPRARQSEIGLMGTPEELNWGYDICDGEDKDKFDLKLIQASTKDNKALSTDYSARLELGYDEKAAMAYVDGQFISLARGLVYYGFSPVRNVMSLPDPGHELKVGMDFNVNPMAFIVFWINGERMHVVKEYELPNSDTEDACIRLREDFGARLKEVFPDASGNARHTNAPGGRSDFHILREHGFTVRTKGSNPPRRDRFNAVNGRLNPRGRDEPYLTLEPDCKRLKRYMLEHSHERMTEQKHMTHLTDALGYPVAFLFSITRVKQQRKLVGH